MKSKVLAISSFIRAQHQVKCRRLADCLSVPRKIGMGTLLSLAACYGSSYGLAEAHGVGLSTRHVPEAVLKGTAKFLQHLPPSTTLRFDVTLPLGDANSLKTFLDTVYDPSSKQYRQFVTPQEFAKRFGPTQNQYDAVVAFGKSQGFRMLGGSRNQMNVQFESSVESIERAFHVKMNRYQHPIENRTFFSADKEPTTDTPLALWHISGLDDFSPPRPASLHRTERLTHPAAGITYDGFLVSSALRSAYYTGSLTGTGQTVGLLQFTAFNPMDAALTFSNSGNANSVPINPISVAGSTPTCTTNCDLGKEQEPILDIVQAASMAPGLSAINVYVGAAGTSPTALLAAIAAHSPVDHQVSSSWSWGPADPTSDDPYFMRFAAQGQSYFNASGDYGNYAQYAKYYSGITYPADDAWVTSVGGTDISLNSLGEFQSETAWSGSGGGISPNGILIPNWQTQSGVVNSANQGSTTLRNVPDVSANAGAGVYICSSIGGGPNAPNGTATGSQVCEGWGGTSAASPLWAGLLGLTNQQSLALGHGAVGFVNVALYSLGTSQIYNHVFNDISSGSNGLPATTGYDLVTGWGSPKGLPLANALSGVNVSYFSAIVDFVMSDVLASQTITFPVIAPQPLAEGGFAVSAMDSAGLPISYTSSTPSVCTVSGNRVTLLAAGTCSITASQSGNGTYAPASVTDTFLVTAGGADADTPLPLWSLVVLSVGLLGLASRGSKRVT